MKIEKFSVLSSSITKHFKINNNNSSLYNNSKYRKKLNFEKPLSTDRQSKNLRRYVTNNSWENKNNVPCVIINSNISNSSEYSNYNNNKIVITKKKIDQLGAIDLIDVLQLVPDINISQSGPKGQQASMFMRGTNSNHILVMINGVPINDQSTAQGLHDFGVDFIQTVQQVEIYPGSSSTHLPKKPSHPYCPLLYCKTTQKPQAEGPCLEEQSGCCTMLRQIHRERREQRQRIHQ